MNYFLLTLFAFLTGFIFGAIYAVNNSAVVRDVLEFFLRYVVPMFWGQRM
jgi:hypothetical protein